MDRLVIIVNPEAAFATAIASKASSSSSTSSNK
jgi:hypothetical protein